MKQYTGMYIIRPTLTDEGYQAIIADINALFESKGGKVLEVNEKTHHIKLSIKDIDYRYESDTKIKETEHGFQTLKENLDSWIAKKFEEISQKNNG